MKTFLSLLLILLWTNVFANPDMNDPSFDTTSTKLKRFVVLGNGGGFTGMVTQYYLFRNGNVFKSSGLDTKPSFYKKLPRKIVCTIFKELKSLQLDTMNMDHPGNMYYFIESHSDGTASKVTWGENNFVAPEAVTTFYHTTLEKITRNRLY